MAKRTEHILKDIKLQGQCRIETAGPIPPSQQEPETNPSTSPAQARVIENHADYAIIELTCSCGCVTNLRCNYNTE